MCLCYVLLSPTFGMHQYTADLAETAARAGHEVHLVTTRCAPPGRYSCAVALHTPVATRNTGLGPAALARALGLALWQASGHRSARLPEPLATICGLAPDLVHFTGPHLWNVPLLRALARAGIPTLHSLHDPEPHSGTPYGRLLVPWNRQVVRHAGHIIVHSGPARRAVLAWGAGPYTLSDVCSSDLFFAPARRPEAELLATSPRHEPWALFFGRLERYKGLDVLLTAWDGLQRESRLPSDARLVLAGKGRLARRWRSRLPAGVDLRARLIEDEEALDLFGRCAVVVLPYLDATQSALVAAAAYFRKPVIVTRAGALAEHVEPGATGWVVAPGDAGELARALGEALADPQRLARMGEAARAWYERQRALERETIEALYARVCATEGQR